MSMLTRALPALALLALSGCVSVPVQLSNPALVQGIVTRPHYTGWARNFCHENELVRSSERWSSDNCLPHGGEIDAVVLESPRDADGKSLGRALRVGLPTHGLIASYRGSHNLILQRSPADFLAATGIAYVATVSDTYNAARRCFDDSGYAHLDRRQCPDLRFHILNRKRCVPQAELLAHLAAGL